MVMDKPVCTGAGWSGRMDDGGLLSLRKRSECSLGVNRRRANHAITQEEFGAERFVRKEAEVGTGRERELAGASQSRRIEAAENARAQGQIKFIHQTGPQKRAENLATSFANQPSDTILAP